MIFVQNKLNQKAFEILVILVQIELIFVLHFADQIQVILLQIKGDRIKFFNSILASNSGDSSSNIEYTRSNSRN